MALSQVQCLDDNHVNPRIHESKPEFFYCEDQRLALEALLRHGREAFVKYLQDRGLRGFLSDPELESLAGAVEPYDPGLELFPGNAEDGEPPLSLHYWPELSDTSIPQMDLGWPDSDAYRGVTRTTVYTQPPLDGQTHVKEIVRKMIAQAQKVIAVVMDVFTDVDIFRDLLDAGFKRRVSVYILLERTTLPHFLSMCQRANMHPGHLKNLRVRCTEGAAFYTRSCTKVRGQLGHRFMFIDGDKAVSGSYSFTWMSSRLDRNLITVVTGQAVDAFDRLFRFLYVNSSSVDLRQVATEPEPEPEPLPQPATVAPPSAALARKLYNPKYALVAAVNPSPAPSSGHSSPKEPQNSANPEVPETKKKRRGRGSKDTIQETPPLHPGLINLEKACLISYLPTWPEPDPPSDVIGFINIRDANKPTQVHLQRSEMFETSQAIRFRSPFSMPKETLPEVTQPRQLTTAKHEEMSKVQPTQKKTKAEKLVVDRVQPTQLNAEPDDTKTKGEAPEQKSSTSGQKFEPDKDTTKALDMENKLHSNTPTNQDASHNTTPAHTPSQSSSKTSTPNTGRPLYTTQTVTTHSSEPQSLPGSYTTKEAESSLNTQSAVVDRTHTLELSAPTDSNSDSDQHTQTKTELPQTDSHTQAVQTQQHNSSEMTPNIQTPTIHSHISTSATSATRPQSASSTSLSEKNHTALPTVHSRIATNVCTSAPSTSCSSSVPPISSSTVLNPPLPPSSAPSSLISTPPIPKPRTVQLVIRDDGTSSCLKLPEISVVRRPESLASMGPPVVHSKPDVVANVAQTPPEKEPETVPQLQNNSGSKTEAQKDTENTGNPEEAPQQKQNVTVGLHDDRAATQSAAGTKTQAQSDVFITDAPKEDSVNIQEINPKEVEPKSLTSTDCKITPKTETDCVATVQTDTKAEEETLIDSEFAQVSNEKRENVIESKAYLAKAREPQRISYCELNTADLDVLETVDSLKASTHSHSVSATTNSHTSRDRGDDSTQSQQGNTSVISAHHTDSKPSTAKHNAHISVTSQQSTNQQTTKAWGGSHAPERPLRLHLSDTHTPDLRSPTAERESRALAALARTPTPDGFLPRTPTPDSRMHTPDSRPYTPDFRTPTPDISDGYISPREDSTTSEEYFECSDSPFHDPVFDRAPFRNHGATVDHDSFTNTNTPNATTITTIAASPAYINNTTPSNTLGTTDKNTSSSETQSLSGPARVSTSSSLLEKSKMGEEKEATNEENGGEEDQKGRKPSVAERKTERDSQGTERRGSDVAKRTADHLKQAKELAEMVEKDKEAQSQTPKRKRALNQSAAERLVDGGATPGESTNKATDAKRLSTGDLKPEKVPSGRERPDKEKVVDKVTLRPSAVDRKDRPPSTRETEGQKYSVQRTPVT
ncbi:mucin-17-like isoform X2 [Toxotes jaculatrix]|uniref:mucin-17-like isoform X2 n=1 Tax=Toxotes jaculatrix TaxID=941984 RepID=UPI001B3AE74D|nr:mucin-17-like isoform X2 [Toxotes jaculatrix]